MPTRKRPVLLFVGSFPPPGSRVFGGNVTASKALVASSLAEQVELVLLDSATRSIPPPPLWVRAQYAARRVLRFIGLVERRRPDVTLLFSAQGWSFVEKSLCAWYAKLRGVRTLQFIRAGPFIDEVKASRVRRAIARVLFAGSDHLLCQGERWRQFYADVFGFPPERCPIVPNWTASPEYLARGRSRQPTTRTPVRMLFVGWLDESKGVLELLEAVDLVIRLRPDLDLVLDLCGEGAVSAQGRTYAREHGFEQKVRFRGWVDDPEKLELFMGSDIFVLPSHAEGLPNAMIEAMSCGLPVIVTPVGSIVDAVTDGIEGLVVPVKDSLRLAGAIERLAADPSLRWTMGRAALNRAERDFRVEAAVDRLMRIIRDEPAENPRADPVTPEPDGRAAAGRL